MFDTETDIATRQTRAKDQQVQRTPCLTASRVARLLALAAAPVCLATCVFSSLPGEQPLPLCTGWSQPVHLQGMATMYGLMGAFHLVPWFRVYTQWRGPATGSSSST